MNIWDRAKKIVESFLGREASRKEVKELGYGILYGAPVVTKLGHVIQTAQTEEESRQAILKYAAMSQPKAERDEMEELAKLKRKLDVLHSEGKIGTPTGRMKKSSPEYQYLKPETSLKTVRPDGTTYLLTPYASGIPWPEVDFSPIERRIAPYIEEAKASHDSTSGSGGSFGVGGATGDYGAQSSSGGENGSDSGSSNSSESSSDSGTTSSD